MSKGIKILFVLILFIIVIEMFSVTYAVDGSIQGWAKDFDEKGAGGQGNGNMDAPIQTIAGILSGIGVFGVVIVGSILGIQYMIGSASDQAKIKESLIPYAVGSIIVMGAVGIFNAVIGALNNSGI